MNLIEEIERAAELAASSETTIELDPRGPEIERILTALKESNNLRELAMRLTAYEKMPLWSRGDVKLQGRIYNVQDACRRLEVALSMYHCPKCGARDDYDGESLKVGLVCGACGYAWNLHHYPKVGVSEKEEPQ